MYNSEHTGCKTGVKEVERLLITPFALLPETPVIDIDVTFHNIKIGKNAGYCITP
jgi:hypothetical protein